jgi:hypothetical protein
VPRRRACRPGAARGGKRGAAPDLQAPGARAGKEPGTVGGGKKKEGENERKEKKEKRKGKEKGKGEKRKKKEKKKRKMGKIKRKELGKILEKFKGIFREIWAKGEKGFCGGFRFWVSA